MNKINLIPEVKQQKLKSRQSNQLATSVAVIVALGLGFAVFSMAAYAALLTTQKSSYDKEIASVQDSLDSMKDLEATVTNLEHGINNIKGILAGSKDWNNLFGYIEKNTPNDIQIMSMSVNGSEISLSLKGKEVKSIDRFIGAFSSAKNDNDENIFSDVNVVGYTKKDNSQVVFESKFNMNEAAIWK